MPLRAPLLDFTDPARGWPELPLIGIERLEERDLDPAPRWVDAGTVECHLWDGGERVTLRRDGDAMRVVERWISEAEQRRRDDEARADAEYDARGEAFRASDPVYLRLVELAGEMPLLRERIAEGPDQVWFRFRSSKAKATADLRWKRDRGPLSVVTYVDGRTHGELEFPWSIVGIEDAVRAVATTLT